MRNRAPGFALKRSGIRGQAVVLLLIVLVVVGGIVWWLFRARDKSEAEARAFAKEAATRLAFHHDVKFLNARLGPQVQTKYPPSFRDRFFDRLRSLGSPSGSPDVEGRVMFTSQFFQPVGEFSCRIDYPHAPATIALGISRPSGWWQIDYFNLTWTPPGQPAAPPVAIEPPAGQ
jgi:cbb3-type cytochrome oxidase subunit 3